MCAFFLAYSIHNNTYTYNNNMVILKIILTIQFFNVLCIAWHIVTGKMC